MAPIPRCDLRLPSEPDDGRRSPRHGSPRAQADDRRSPRAKADDRRSSPSASQAASAQSAQPARQLGSGRGSLHAQRSPTRDSAEILERAPGSGRGSLHAQRSPTRDSAEILERAPGFSTGVTRDAGEIREHKLHEGEAADEGADPMDAAGSGRLAEDASQTETGGAGAVKVDGTECPTSCTTLEESLSELEAAAAAVDDEDVTSVAPAAAAGAAATPGDVCAQFCEERPESPSSGYSVRKAIGAHKMAKKRGAQKCKGTYASLETYEGLWGSSKAVGARKKLELEMRKKRKYYERLHERNKRRREKERRRAKEKRRMLRCRDQSKIPESVGDISINKAFYFRFNYNQRLPFLPSAMDQHLKRFKRPPFRRYQKGSRPCRKLVDEFEKLRVFDAKSGPKSAGRPAKAKALK